MKEFKILIGVMICYPLLLGTTYVIKEGELEVGRWEEKDGKDGVEIVENEKQAKNSLNPKPNLPAMLVIADFDSGNAPNNVGGSFGAWDKDPDDKTQGCFLSFVADDALRNTHGNAIRLDYDVDSPNKAYCGFWTKLNGLDATAFNTINFYIRGDAAAGFSKNIKVELQDQVTKANQRYHAVSVSGINGQWQKISIPLKNFTNISTRNQIMEFIILVNKEWVTSRKGAFYIDQIFFSKE